MNALSYPKILVYILIITPLFLPFATATEQTSVYREPDKLEESIGYIVVSGAKGVGTVAKKTATILGKSAQFMYEQIKQKELADQFYVLYAQNEAALEVMPRYHDALRDRVTGLYIQEDQKHELGLDLVTFHDMRDVMRQQYAQLLLHDAHQGTQKTYYLNGNIQTQRRFLDGELHGEMTTFYEDGSVKFIDVYQYGRLINRQKFNTEGKLEFKQEYLAVKEEIS